MPAARVVAQAKINLVLRVLARETTGYHQIETLFCRLALGDVVSVRPTDGPRSLYCTGPMLPAPGLGPVEENLAWRAAAAYARHTGWPAGFAIEIEKRIAVGGGLGGGSADAGAVLRALNAMAPAPLSLAALLAVGASLGADVPFLTQDVSPLVLAWGRGDRLMALPALPSRACWLFVPAIAVSTRDAYSWIDGRTMSSGAMMMTPDELTSWTAIAGLAHNDFEDVVGERIPAIAAALAALRAPAAQRLIGTNAIIQMSGSGSALYVIEGEPAERHGYRQWRSDEPGFAVIPTTTAERVEAVAIVD